MSVAIAKSQPDDIRLGLARDLVKALENQNEQTSNEIITELARESEINLFNEIGRLTREVHEALSLSSISHRFSEMANNDIPDARERLYYVIDKTEESANRTLDIAEELLALAERNKNLEDDLRSDCVSTAEVIFDRNDVIELAYRLISYFEEKDEKSLGFRTAISELIVAQGFQDLTGQVIRQVIELVQEIEQRLVVVIRNASPLPANDLPLVSDISAEGPQVNAKSKDTVVNDQDEVDDLLLSLGF